MTHQRKRATRVSPVALQHCSVIAYAIWVRATPRLRRRNATPIAPKPKSIIAQVLGSGTAATEAAVASVRLSTEGQKTLFPDIGLYAVTAKELIVPVDVKPRKLEVVGLRMTSVKFPRLSVTSRLICADGTNAPEMFELKKKPPIADAEPLKFEKFNGSIAELVAINLSPDTLPGKRPLIALTSYE